MGKRRIIFITKIVLAMIVLLWVIKKVDYNTIIQSFQNPQSPIFIYLGIFLLIPNLTLQWYRWFFLLRLIQPDISVSDSIVSLFGGLTVGLITPGRIGEFGRALFLRQINYANALGLIFIDKFYASVQVIIFGIWGVISFLGFKLGYHRFLFAPLVGLALVITMLGISLMINPTQIRTFFYNVSLFLPFRDKMKQFIDGLDHFKTQQARPFIIFSVALYLIYIVQFSFFSLAFESLSVKVLFTATTSTMFTKIVLPFSIGDLGIREGAAIYFFKNFQVQKVTAFNSAFLLFLINVMLPAIVGLLFIPRLGWRENDHSEKP